MFSALSVGFWRQCRDGNAGCGCSTGLHGNSFCVRPQAGCSDVYFPAAPVCIRHSPGQAHSGQDEGTSQGPAAGHAGWLVLVDYVSRAMSWGNRASSLTSETHLFS